MEKNTEIYGIRAVIEAINSSKDIDKVFIQTGLKGKLIGQLESLIRKNKINFSYVPTQKLDRLSKKNHQEKLAASAEESANMISGLIIDGLVKPK